MSFPPGTEMFQFPGFAFIPLFDLENKYLLVDLCWSKDRKPPSLIETTLPAHLNPVGLCSFAFRSHTRLFGATEIEGGFPHSEIHGSKPVRGSP